MSDTRKMAEIVVELREGRPYPDDLRIMDVLARHPGISTHVLCDFLGAAKIGKYYDPDKVRGVLRDLFRMTARGWIYHVGRPAKWHPSGKVVIRKVWAEALQLPLEGFL